MADKPTVSRSDADSVVEKLRDLRKGMNPGEQLVLDNLVSFFETRVSEPGAQDLLNDFPEASGMLDEVAGFALAARPGQPDAAITPTVTITTTVTVAASHPWITCALAQKPGGGRL